jgi:hypothetical protein
LHTGSQLDLSIDRRAGPEAPDSDRRAEARGARTRDPGSMCIDRSCAAAAAELAARRSALVDALDALDRGDPGADPIAAIDCALAVQAAEAVVEREALNAPALPA